ncbi:hypothetical protein PR001_g17058 [Phytophthora rubi]|uniref:Uncharacterized protein n=1 Tax=Phytophthora rubi TaxID=129364 RepID=A0A6A3KI97_9STRA|nr:hypothetical protein PR001_g17058 [Phytophthora rubi]
MKGGMAPATAEVGRGDLPSPTERAVSYATAVRNGQGASPENTVHATPRTVVGPWSPRERHLLLATLDRDWHLSHEPTSDGMMGVMRDTALRHSAVHSDTALRPRTDMETQTLLAYLGKELELPHPPIFLKATMQLLERAAIEQFHEVHCEVMLTAAVSPSAKLRRGMTHNALAAQLFSANTDSAKGKQMIGRLMDDVKMLFFDGVHTLKFVFNSRRVADFYLGLAFRLNGTCIELEDSDEGAPEGTYLSARMRRQYAIRVYGAGNIGLVTLIAALDKLPGVKVMDAERPRVDSTEIMDNRYLVLHFAAEDCPEALRGVTKIDFQGQVITLHHHLLRQRLPCARCFAPFHTTGFCKTPSPKLRSLQSKYKRTYHGPIHSFLVGEEMQYKHSDADSLDSFLRELRRAVSTSATPPGDGLEGTVAASLSITLDDASGSTPGQDAQPAGAHPSTRHAHPTGSISLATSSGDGFQTAHRKGGKVRVANAKAAVTDPTPPVTTTAKGATMGGTCKQDGGPAAGKKRVTPAAAGARAKHPGPRKSGKALTGQTFTQFQTERAMGRYAVLADQAEDCSDVDSEEEKAEAPYAYTQSPRQRQASQGVAAPLRNGRQGATPVRMDASPANGSTTLEEPVAAPTSTDTSATTDLGRSGSASDTEMEREMQEDTDMDEDLDSVLSGYVGSSAPSTTQSPAPPPAQSFRSR